MYLFLYSHCASQKSLYVQILKTHHLVKSPLLLFLCHSMSFLKRLQMAQDAFVEAYLYASSAHLCSLIHTIQLPMHLQRWFRFADGSV